MCFKNWSCPIMSKPKNLLLNWYSSMKKNYKNSDYFWHRKLTQNVRILQFLKMFTQLCARPKKIMGILFGFEHKGWSYKMCTSVRQKCCHTTSLLADIYSLQKNYFFYTDYSCNKITTNLIQISRLFYFGLFSKTNHQMI